MASARRSKKPARYVRVDTAAMRKGLSSALRTLEQDLLAQAVERSIPHLLDLPARSMDGSPVEMRFIEADVMWLVLLCGAEGKGAPTGRRWEAVIHGENANSLVAGANFRGGQLELYGTVNDAAVETPENAQMDLWD